MQEDSHGEAGDNNLRQEERGAGVPKTPPSVLIHQKASRDRVQLVFTAVGGLPWGNVE